MIMFIILRQRPGSLLGLLLTNIWFLVLEEYQLTLGLGS